VYQFLSAKWSSRRGSPQITVKAPEAKTRGYDAGKKIVGRKRHIAVDTDGRLLMIGRRHLRQRRGSDDPGRCAQALAVAEASVRRWGL
jgi:hypothetical protein